MLLDDLQTILCNMLPRVWHNAAIPGMRVLPHYHLYRMTRADVESLYITPRGVGVRFDSDTTPKLLDSATVQDATTLALLISDLTTLGCFPDGAWY